MAKLFLGTREVTPSMYKGSSGSGYSELPAYEVSNGTASKRTKVLDGTEFEGITTIDAGAFQYAFYGKDISGYLNLSSVVTINGNGLNQAGKAIGGGLNQAGKAIGNAWNSLWS